MTFRKQHPPPGARPGTLAIPPDAPPPRIRVVDYGIDGFEEHELDDPEALIPFRDSPRTAWVDVHGFGDEAKLWAIAKIFGLHPLVLEDATNVPQRAKSEVRPEAHIFVARLPVLQAEGGIEVPQVCLILGRRFLLTFQARSSGFLDPVRQRIREGIGPIREQGPDYLAYAIIDTLVDRYYPLVEGFAQQLEDLEEEVTGEGGEDVLVRIHRIRRQLVVVRRVGWPQREAVGALIREHSPFVTDNVRLYLRDTEDHLAQIVELVDSSRDMTTALTDIHLSHVSQRTNEVMKVLTLMASIFIPLSFLAGLYGMNFDHMPELHSRWGYPMLLAAMLALSLGMVLWFRRKGWLGARRPRRGPGR